MKTVPDTLPSDNFGMQQQPWWMLPSFGYIAAAIYVIALGLSFLREDKTLFSVMCGASIGFVNAPYNFFFGSSASSARKDDALAATSIKQNETIAAQGVALATSMPVKQEPEQPKPSA
jgi:hypothetical protein